MKFYGRNSNLIKCIKLFFVCFNNINPIHFDLVKEEIKLNLINSKYDSPYERIKSEFVDKYYNYKPSTDEMLEMNDKMKIEDVTIDKKFFIEMIIFGNCNPYLHLSLYNEIIEEYGNSSKYRYNEAQVPKSFQFRSEDKINNSVGIFIKFTDRKNLKEIACAEILVQNSSELFFDNLRTKETLGYIVYNRLFYTDNSVFYLFVVQGEKSCKFTENRIFKYIQDYKNNLSLLEHFEKYKNAAISAFSEDFKNLREFAYFNVNLYFLGGLDLEYKSKMVNVLRGISKDDLKLDGECIVVKALKKKSN